MRSYGDPPAKYRNAHAKQMDVGMRPLGTGGGLEIAVFNPLSLPQLIFSQDSHSGFNPTRKIVVEVAEQLICHAISPPEV